MSKLIVDTYLAIKELVSSGFEENQADGVVRTINSADLSSLATKADILEAKSDIAELRAEFKLEMSDMKSDLQRWMITLMLGQTALMTAIMTALIKFL